MDQHFQYVTVRNDRGQELLDSVKGSLETQPTVSTGDRRLLVAQTVMSDDEAKMGKLRDPAPTFVGNLIAWILNLIGPKGLEFAKYSIAYHYVRNYIYVMRHWSPSRAAQHIPDFARTIVRPYDKNGEITERLKMRSLAPPKAFPKK